MNEVKERRVEIDGIELRLHEFCGYCPDFETDIDKIDMTTLAEPYRRVATVIRCRNRDKCLRLHDQMEKKHETR